MTKCRQPCVRMATGTHERPAPVPLLPHHHRFRECCHGGNDRRVRRPDLVVGLDVAPPHHTIAVDDVRRRMRNETTAGVRVQDAVACDHGVIGIRQELKVGLHAVRDDVEMTGGEIRQVTAPVANVHRGQSRDAMQVTQALMGERALVFEARDGWTWVKLLRDGYVGCIEDHLLSSSPVEPTHRVAVPQTFLYAGANIKSQPVVTLTLNALVRVAGGDEKFAVLEDGRCIFARHLKPAAESEADFVEVAKQFLHAPYLWGGKSALGLDCSGLCQLALEAAGIAAPRDADMQEAALGSPVMANDLDGLKRGDLVFWDGHVGIMADAANLLHANGFHMQVVLEPLRGAAERIARSYGAITSIKRLG